MDEYDEYESVDRLELPRAPRSLWDFVNILTPVLKYYVALLVLFLGARWFNRQLDSEAAAQEQETQQQHRPTLSPELTVESSEDEESSDEEEIEELVTDGDLEQELRDKKDKEDADDNVSWNELHSSMLKRYKDKYPNHGPRVADPETDKYDEEFNELLRKNNINPEDLKSQSATKTE
ncbi:hypothetical protein GN244_ATG20202 [Phytophthora infestans]|uniref:Uncharacterized protein n=1 Tax=Phytophthora infestans TaxID=4787 RepID=A0A833STD6_PHYIN|nr:hypothetical protein GN244_ATG20202 [Phytophthora infestans]